MGCDERLLQQSSMESQRYARRLLMELLHRHDVQPCSVSTQVSGLLEAELPLHIMLHGQATVVCTRRSDNADGHRRLTEVTTLFRGEKTQEE